MPEMTQTDVENKFRDSIGDILTILDKLSPYCKTIDDLIGLLELSIKNDAQLRLLLGRLVR